MYARSFAFVLCGVRNMSISAIILDAGFVVLGFGFLGVAVEKSTQSTHGVHKEQV